MLFNLIRGVSRFFRSVGQFFARAFKEGIKRDELYRTFRDANIEYPRGYFNMDWAKAKYSWEYMSRAKYIRRDRYIPPERYITVDAVLKRRYYSVFEMDVFNYDTEEYETRTVTIAHDTPRQRLDLETEAITRAEDTSPDIEVRNIRIVGLYRSRV